MLYGFFYFLSICPTAQAGPRHDSLVGLVGLVGQAAPMPDSLVGQAAGFFVFFHKSETRKVPGTRARPVLSGFEPGPRPWQVLGIFMKQRREVK